MTNPTTETWTPERVLALRSLYDQGLSGGLIAERLGLTRSTVMGKLYRMGLTGRTSTAKKARPGRRPDLSQEAEQERAVARRLAAIRSAALAHEERNREALRAALKDAGSVVLDDLKPYHCRWPQKGGGFCGELKERGSYCARHAKEAYRPVQKRKR